MLKLTYFVAIPTDSKSRTIAHTYTYILRGDATAVAAGDDATVFFFFVLLLRFVGCT